MSIRIAVIEDEKKLAKILRKGLETENYVIDLFFDGQSAYEALEKTHASYDLMVLDLFLPRLNGFDVCSRLRSEGITLPILVLTARDATEDKVKALDSGADDFITKPFAFDEFLARIRALLRRPHEVVSETIQLGDLRMNIHLREVYRGNERVALTIKEFDLLHHLMRHPGQVFRRDELFNHLREHSNERHSNLVDVHIRNLRKKIDDPYSRKYIQTIRGIGYALKG